MHTPHNSSRHHQHTNTKTLQYRPDALLLPKHRDANSGPLHLSLQIILFTTAGTYVNPHLMNTVRIADNSWILKLVYCFTQSREMYAKEVAVSCYCRRHSNNSTAVKCVFISTFFHVSDRVCFHPCKIPATSFSIPTEFPWNPGVGLPIVLISMQLSMPNQLCQTAKGKLA